MELDQTVASVVTKVPGMEYLAGMIQAYAHVVLLVLVVMLIWLVVVNWALIKKWMGEPVTASIGDQDQAYFASERHPVVAPSKGCSAADLAGKGGKDRVYEWEEAEAEAEAKAKAMAGKMSPLDVQLHKHLQQH